VAGLVDNHTVFRGFFDLGDNNRSLVTVLFVESGEIRKGVFTDNIGIQDEEGRIILSEDFFCEFEGASCA
jgi:hypothetical protein